jgi:septum site-determining protein MinD
MSVTIAVAGAKDGVGKTTFALHLAYGLYRLSRKNICLLEADVANIGDLKTSFNVRQLKSFVDFSKQAARMDSRLAQSWIGKHPSGLYLLGGGSFVTDFQALEDAEISRSLKLINRSFDYTIVDVGRDFNPLSYRIFEQSAAIFVVTTSNIYSINQASEFCNHLRSLHFGSDVQRLIVNQFDPKGVISTGVIKQKFKMDASALLPDDREAFKQVTAQAKPLHMINPKHPYIKGIEGCIKIVNSAAAQIDKSRVSKSPGGQPLDQLKQVLPFTLGSGSGSSQPVAVKGSVVNPNKQRNLAIRARVHERLLELVDLKEMDAIALEKDDKKKRELMNKTANAIQRLLEEEAKSVENRNERSQLAKDILDEALGLGPIEQLLEAEDVTEIMVNGKDQIFVEQGGKITLSDLEFTSDKQLLGCIERIVSPIGRRVDEKTPLCDARLKDGSRINIIISPLSLKGPAITIRKFFKEKLTIQDMVKFGTLTEEMADFMRAAVEARLNIVISGGTGSGKTTLLNLVSGFIPEDERIVTVEDAAELQLPQEHVITLETRPPNLQGEGAISIRDLVRNSLRMRPDRIVVGECRGGEALDMLQAMNTGHDGSLTTIHSNNPRDCVRRIETLVMMAGFDLPVLAIREQVASAINLIVQLKRYSDGSRKVSHVTEVIGLEGETLVTQPIFEYKQTGTDEKGKVKGVYQPSGLIPKFVEELKQKGIALPKGLFGAKAPPPSSAKPDVSAAKNTEKTPTVPTGKTRPAPPSLKKPLGPRPGLKLRKPGIKKP